MADHEAQGFSAAIERIVHPADIWRFPEMGDPHNGGCLMENPIKNWMMWEYPHFKKPPLGGLGSHWSRPSPKPKKTSQRGVYWKGCLYARAFSVIICLQAFRCLCILFSCLHNIIAHAKSKLDHYLRPPHVPLQGFARHQRLEKCFCSKSWSSTRI